SYVLADYYLMSDSVKDSKKEDIVSIIKHSVPFLVCSLILTIVFFSLYLCFIILLISLAYFTIKKLRMVWDHEDAFVVYISEHLAHIIVIIGAYPLLTPIEPNAYMNIAISKLLLYYPFLGIINN